MVMATSMLCAEGRRASLSVSRDSERAWMIRVATWPSSSFELLACHFHALSYLKMSLVSCRLLADRTLASSSGRWENSGMGSLGEFWTLRSSEFPSDAVASSLSDILETGELQQRYFLTKRACEGILRRADNRGRKLPDALRAALEAQAGKNNN